MYMIMKKWRIIAMNKEEVVENLISYIEEAERNLQASKMSNEPKSVKTDIVNNILDELEKEIKNEN